MFDGCMCPDTGTSGQFDLLTERAYILCKIATVGSNYFRIPLRGDYQHIYRLMETQVDPKQFEFRTNRIHYSFLARTYYIWRWMISSELSNRITQSNAAPASPWQFHATGIPGQPRVCAFPSLAKIHTRSIQIRQPGSLLKVHIR